MAEQSPRPAKKGEEKKRQEKVSGFEVQISPCSELEQVDSRREIMVAWLSDAAERCIPMQALILGCGAEAAAHLVLRLESVSL